jgi:predicted dehydrogenase
VSKGRIRFSVIGLNHGHIYGQVEALTAGGGELVSFFAPEPDLSERFAETHPQARQARVAEEIVEDPSIQLIASASIPNERAPLGVAAMKHGKDFMSDKPAFTTLDQLAEARRTQAETKRIFSVYYSERLGHPATVKAAELVKAGTIGEVIQTIGLGPHRVNAPSRPAWFFKRECYGGILTDIGSHQVDQFLYFTGAASAEVVASQVANYHHPQYPELEDFGDIMLRTARATAYIRVDWFTPAGLSTWGDGRLVVLGTEGYLEVRKNIDLLGRSGGNHLFVVDAKSSRYIDCSDVACPYGRQLVDDVLNRTETAMTQAHCFMASQLALEAQTRARRLGNLAKDG